MKLQVLTSQQKWSNEELIKISDFKFRKRIAFNSPVFLTQVNPNVLLVCPFKIHSTLFLINKKYLSKYIKKKVVQHTTV